MSGDCLICLCSQTMNMETLRGGTTPIWLSGALTVKSSLLDVCDLFFSLLFCCGFSRGAKLDSKVQTYSCQLDSEPSCIGDSVIMVETPNLWREQILWVCKHYLCLGIVCCHVCTRFRILFWTRKYSEWLHLMGKEKAQQ